MLGKKKPVDNWSVEDLRMEELLNALCDHRQLMQVYCRKIIICKGSAEMLPDGPDKDKELHEVEIYQKRLEILISAYNNDLRQYNQIDTSLLVHFTGKANPLTSHEALHVAWELAYSEAMRR